MTIVWSKLIYNLYIYIYIDIYWIQRTLCFEVRTLIGYCIYHQVVPFTWQWAWTTQSTHIYTSISKTFYTYINIMANRLWLKHNFFSGTKNTNGKAQCIIKWEAMRVRALEKRKLRNSRIFTYIQKQNTKPSSCMNIQNILVHSLCFVCTFKLKYQKE